MEISTDGCFPSKYTIVYIITINKYVGLNHVFNIIRGVSFPVQVKIWGLDRITHVCVKYYNKYYNIVEMRKSNVSSNKCSI